MEKRESVEPAFTPRGNSLAIDIAGVTACNNMVTPRGFNHPYKLVQVLLMHALYINLDNYMHGGGAAGRLGLDAEDGDPQKDVVQPRLVQALAGRPVLRVACGYSHTGCIVAGGDVYTWGSAANGKCGLGEIVMKEDCYCSLPTK